MSEETKGSMRRLWSSGGCIEGSLLLMLSFFLSLQFSFTACELAALDFFFGGREWVAIGREKGLVVGCNVDGPVEREMCRGRLFSETHSRNQHKTRKVSAVNGRVGRRVFHDWTERFRSATQVVGRW